MPKKRLTEEGVAKLPAPAAGRQIDYFEAGMPGLVLRVNYGGAKIWRALYYVPSVVKSGKRKGQRIMMPTTHKLGRYPILKLKEARAAAAEGRKPGGVRRFPSRPGLCAWLTRRYTLSGSASTRSPLSGLGPVGNLILSWLPPSNCT